MAEHGPTTAGPGGYERRDVTTRPIVIAAAILIALIVATFVLTRALLDAFDARPGPAASPLAAEYARTAPPEPRLQASPRDDLQRLREAEDRLLHGSAWVDHAAGVVRIPIERAMELCAERGR